MYVVRIAKAEAGYVTMDDKAQQLADLVLIYFLKEELGPEEEKETKDELIELAREIAK